MDEKAQYERDEAKGLFQAQDNGLIISGRWGFVRYVDHMGSDARVVQAARVSYGKGTKSQSTDEALIYRMMRLGHTSPFEQLEILLHCGGPIFTARQLFRHRTASPNELSGRYSEIPEEFWTPFPEDIRSQHKTEKQVSEGSNPNAQAIADLIKGSSLTGNLDYQELLRLGCPREQARAVLPQGQMTQFYWKMDIHNFLKMNSLRDDSHAQPEIREMVKAMGHFVQAMFPLTWAAYDKAIRQGRRLTGPQWEALQNALYEFADENTVNNFLSLQLADLIGRDKEGNLKSEGRELLEALSNAL